jgi:hypothetical protein
MKNKDNKSIREKMQMPPIQDGDARPDKHTESSMKENTSPIPKKHSKKITKERAADSNTMDDYKDAK